MGKKYDEYAEAEQAAQAARKQGADPADVEAAELIANEKWDDMLKDPEG